MKTQDELALLFGGSFYIARRGCNVSVLGGASNAQPNWTTIRWRGPASLRKTRLHELLARKELDEILGSSFLEGLEKRKLEAQKLQFKLGMIQIPLFLFLALSLLNLPTSVTIFGISISDSKHFREVLLLVSAVFGFISAGANKDASDLNELMKSIVEWLARKDSDLKEFLEVRYGLSSMIPMKTFSKDLELGLFQWLAFGAVGLCTLAFVAMAVAIVLAVQIANLVEVYAHPNWSRWASIYM